MGEAYRFKKDPSRAIDAYNRGIQQAPDFGPLYVGMARARLTVDPNANVLPLLDEAVRLEPNFGDAFLERGIVKIRDNDLAGAISDLSQANTLLQNSPVVFYNLAQARFRQGNLD